jgi:hypothetical protein
VTSITDYRKYAEQCLDMAEGAEPEERKALLKMAETWLELARAAALSNAQSEPGQTAPSSDNLQ